MFDSKGKPFRHTLTNKLGNYTFSNLISGTYSITCVKEDIVITLPEKIYLREKDVITKNFKIQSDESLKLCCVAGKVNKFGTPNEPVSNAVVSLLDPESKNVIYSTTTASDGEYLFYDVADGKYVLIATKDGYNVSTETIINAVKNSIINTDILLTINPVQNVGTISGIVSNNNIAIENAFVGLYKVLEDGSEVLVSTTKTNANGLYMFGKVDGGNYKVKAKLNERV